MLTDAVEGGCVLVVRELPWSLPATGHLLDGDGWLLARHELDGDRLAP